MSEEIRGVGISVDGRHNQMGAYLRLHCGGSGEEKIGLGTLQGVSEGMAIASELHSIRYVSSRWHCE